MTWDLKPGKSTLADSLTSTNFNPASFARQIPTTRKFNSGSPAGVSGTGSAPLQHGGKMPGDPGYIETGSEEYDQATGLESGKDYPAAMADERGYGMGKAASSADPAMGKLYNEFQFVDTMVQDYESLSAQIAAANRLGIETPGAQNRLDKLSQQLENSRLKLADDLGALDKQGLQIFADTVNENYGTDTAAIARTKKFLIEDLDLRNKGRTNQTAHLETIFGDITKNLQQAFDASAGKRREGRRAKAFNKEGLLGNASSRGATRSAGLEDSNLEEDAKYRTLKTAMDEADESARHGAMTDRRANRRSIASLVEQGQQDRLKTVNNIGGLDSDLAGLNTQRKSDYGDYLLGIAAIDANEKQRNQERWYGEAQRREQASHRNSMYQNRIAQANANANLAAMQQVAAARDGKYNEQQNSWSENDGSGSNAMWGNWMKAGGDIPANAPANIKQFAAASGYGYTSSGSLTKLASNNGPNSRGRNSHPRQG